MGIRFGPAHAAQRVLGPANGVAPGDPARRPNVRSQAGAPAPTPDARRAIPAVMTAPAHFTRRRTGIAGAERTEAVRQDLATAAVRAPGWRREVAVPVRPGQLPGRPS